MPARLLLVDDTPRIRSFVGRGLSAEGFDVDVAASGPEGLRRALAGTYDLVILDLLMPGIDGIKVLRTLLGHKPDQAVLILSCLDDAGTKASCLDLGADDYLAKPFSFEELLARVRARLRHKEKYAPARDITDGPAQRLTMRAGRLSLDLIRREADAGSGSVPLADREFLLLRELLERPGEVVSKQRLLSAVWGYHTEPDSNIVDVCVWRLRGKLGRDAISTVRGKGYAVDAS